MPPKSLSSATSGKAKNKQKAASVKEDVKKVAEKKEPVAPKKPVGPAKGFAIVKAVLSADTLLLMGAANPDSYPPEKQVIISNIQTPKLARSRNQVDEPFAWEAREFLRKKLIGQQVQFQVTYTHPESGREYANVFWNDENVAHMLVKNGYATVKGASEKKEGRLPPEKEELFQLQEEAEVMGLGIHQRGLLPKETTRQIDWSPNPQEIFDQFKNIPLPAIVDSVRDGSTLRCEVVGLDARNPLSHTMITVHLAGVQAPRTPLPLSVLQQQYDAKNPDSPEDRPTADSQQAEPYAIEAQQFTESRLLNRDVQLTIQGIDKSGNLFGTVSYVKGNISLRLLELGLAKFVPWSAALTVEAPLLREAEAGAKRAQLRLWKNWEESDVVNDPEELPAEMIARVVQILTGDTLIVVDQKGVERRVSLASIRAPRLGRTRNGAGDEPCAAEAKEFLRRNLIGKKVRVIFEYSRPAPAEAADKSLRQNVSIFVGEQNITTQLIAAGLASVIRHRMDEERSQFYEDYMQAETKVQREEKGIHAKKIKAPPRIIDLTERFAPLRKSGKEDAKESKDDLKQRQISAKAKTILPFLQRAGQTDAVVEHVFGGARLKLYAPKDNVMISFALAGIRCSGPKDKEGKPDVFGEQALAFTRSKCLQHNVKIEVETLDKADNFIGNLFVGHQNLAVLLLQEGLASLFQYSADRNPHRAQLIEAERQAKEARRGIWQNYVEPTPEEKKLAEEAEGTSVLNADGPLTVNITEILDGVTFYAHVYPSSSSNPLIRTIEAKMQEFTESAPEAQEFKVENRTICAGLFTDDKYYRVRVEQVLKKTGSDEKEYRVFFIDYGNYDILEMQHLRPLPAEIAKLPPQATLCVLAGLRAPSNEEYKEVATQTFTDLAFGRPLTGKIEFQDYNGFHHIVLHDPEAQKSEQEEQTSINSTLLLQGLVRISPRCPKKLKSFMDQNFKAQEEEARKSRYGIWEYGSYMSDSDD